LRRNGRVVSMEPQTFDVLTYLVLPPATVSSRRKSSWTRCGEAGSITEAAVTGRIKQARRALGDDGREQRLIRTVHGRGYRFVAEVISKTPESPNGAFPVCV
jgi:DNA-binding winged helix-turn-helix (wHTH) protein